MSDVELRPEVRWFAEQMELKLRLNDHKGGWVDCDTEYLLSRLKDEYVELEEALNISCPHCGRRMSPGNITNVLSECLDIANFALMIADTHDKEND